MGGVIARRPLSVALVVSILASVHFTHLYYPGVLYPDSYERWAVAHALLSGGRKSSYLSVAPSLWMALTYGLTRQHAAYTLLQSFLFFFSTLLVLHRCAGLGGAGLALVAALLAIVPLGGAYSVYHEGGIGAVIGLNFLLVLLLDRAPRAGAGRLLAHGAGLFLAIFTVLGFRQNALTVVPAVVWLAWRSSTSRGLVLVRWAAVVAAIGAVAVLPRALGYAREDASSVGLAWEIAQTLQRVDDPRYAKYLDYTGNTRGAVSSRLEDNIWEGLFAPGGLDFATIRVPHVAAKIRQDYLALVTREPRAFAATKWHVTKRVLGVGRPLAFVEFSENSLDRMPTFGWQPTESRHRAIRRLEGFMATMWWMRTPWLVFLAALAFVRVGSGPVRDGRGFAWAALGLAALYYGAFLVTTQGYEFRYFFPALHLSLLAVAAVAIGMARALVPSVPATPLRSE